MPKFIATSGSFFRPYSYDELVKPIAHMQEAHNAAQEAYDTLDMQTSALRHYISDNPEMDQRARAMYDNYMDKLSTLQNNLWEHGYNAQTKRDLSAAKSAYNSDIARLAQAIQTRQKRAEEFWEAKRKDPTLIQGKDPGIASLDEYLADDNYGRNWFSYSGKDFEKEVGDEVKARAAGLLDDISRGKVVANPQLPQTLTRILTQGVTNDEIAFASRLVDQIADLDAEQRRAVYDGLKANNQLSDGAELLSEALLSRLDATGIRGGDVSLEGWRSLINRGKAGWSQGVMTPVVKDFDNPAFELQMAQRKADIDFENYKRKKALDTPKPPTGGNSNWPGYSLQSISSYREDQKAKEITSLLNKNVFHPFDEPIPVTGTDGQPDVIANYSDASRILSSFGKDELIREYGIDPDKQLRPGKPLEVNTEHGKLRISMAAPGGYGQASTGYNVSVQKEDGTYEKDLGLSADLTNKYNDYQNRVKTWKQNNKGVNIQELAIKQDDRKAMYDAGNIPYDIPFEYVPFILATQAKVGDITAAQLADHTKEHEPVREDYGLAIIRAFLEGPTDRKGKRSKTGDTAFYAVDGYNVSDKGETDIQKVFGTKNEGNEKVPNEKSVSAIYITPEDVINNRAEALINGKTWAFNPKMLGNDVDAQIGKLKEEYKVPKTDERGNLVYDKYGNPETKVLDSQGIVHFLMKPVLDPIAAIRMTEEEINDWIYYYNLEAGDNDFSTIFTDESGNIVELISPKDVVKNERLQEKVRTNVTKLIDKTIAEARDNMVQRSIQRRSGTSGNPSGYNE